MIKRLSSALLLNSVLIFSIYAMNGLGFTASAYAGLQNISNIGQVYLIARTTNTLIPAGHMVYIPLQKDKYSGVILNASVSSEGSMEFWLKPQGWSLKGVEYIGKSGGVIAAGNPLLDNVMSSPDFLSNCPAESSNIVGDVFPKEPGLFFYMHIQGGIEFGIINEKKTAIQLRTETAILEDNRWHHIRVAWSTGLSSQGGHVSLYIDGILKAKKEKIDMRFNGETASICFGSYFELPQGLSGWFDGFAFSDTPHMDAIYDRYNHNKLMCFSAPASFSPKTGLYAYYPLHGTCSDESGLGHFGVGNALKTNMVERAGRQVPLFEFKGNTMIMCGAYGLFGVGDGLSVSCWTAPARNIDSDILGVYSTNIPKGWRLAWSNNSFRFDIASEKGIQSIVSEPKPQNTDRAYHVAAVLHNYLKIMRMYINGELMAEVPVNGFIHPFGKMMYIGGTQAIPTFSGTIENVRIYERPVLANEVQSIYYMERQQDIATASDMERLFHAGGRDDADTVRGILASNRGLMDRTDDNGNTPLHWAVYMGCNKVVSFLIDSGAAITVKDRSGNSPLETAIRQGNKGAADILISMNAPVNGSDAGDGDPPIVLAVMNNDIELVRTLHAKGASCNTVNKKGEPLLLIAFQKNYIALAKLLQEYGATVLVNKKKSDPGYMLLDRWKVQDQTNR